MSQPGNMQQVSATQCPKDDNSLPNANSCSDPQHEMLSIRRHIRLHLRYLDCTPGCQQPYTYCIARPKAGVLSI